MNDLINYYDIVRALGIIKDIELLMEQPQKEKDDFDYRLQAKLTDLKGCLENLV